MDSPVARTNILYMYKNLLKMAKGLPEKKREQSVRTIKEDFRKNMGELDPLLVSEMLTKANSTLGDSHHEISTIQCTSFVLIVKGTSVTGTSTIQLFCRLFEDCYSEAHEEARRKHKNYFWISKRSHEDN